MAINDQIRDFIKWRWGTTRAAAQALGVHEAWLSDVFRGRYGIKLPFLQDLARFGAVIQIKGEEIVLLRSDEGLQVGDQLNAANLSDAELLRILLDRAEGKQGSGHGG